MALHNPTWLVWADAGAVISENSREVYNYFNPSAPVDQTNSGIVPNCNLLGSPAVTDLLSPTYGVDPVSFSGG